MRMSGLSRCSEVAGTTVNDSCAQNAGDSSFCQGGLDLGALVFVCVVSRGLSWVRKCNGSISGSHKRNPRRSLRTYVNSEVERVN